jgi:hypothetical protein
MIYFQTGQIYTAKVFVKGVPEKKNEWRYGNSFNFGR